MEFIGKKLDKSPLAKLTRIDDIIHFEGPMLVLYKNKQSGNLFLCDWVDKDDKNNRWLLYKTSPLALYQFIQGNFEQIELFRTKYSNSEFWSFDVSTNFEHHNFSKIHKNELPPTYLPQKGVFFEKSDCKNFSEIERFLKSEILKELWQKMALDLSNTLSQIAPTKNNKLNIDLFASVKNTIENSVYL
jgi:hypothetical protein